MSCPLQVQVLPDACGPRLGLSTSGVSTRAELHAYEEEYTTACTGSSEESIS